MFHVLLHKFDGNWIFSEQFSIENHRWIDDCRSLFSKHQGIAHKTRLSYIYQKTFSCFSRVTNGIQIFTQLKHKNGKIKPE